MDYTNTESLKSQNLNLTELAAHPIPLELPSVAGWKEVSLIPVDEPLVPLGFDSEYPIYTDSIYFGEHSNSPYDGGLEGSLATIFVRQGVAKRLIRAETMLPRGLHIIVFDAYRPLEVQDALFQAYSGALRELHSDWAEEQILAESQKYVSLPSTNPDRPSPHNTGGSVDLALYRLPQEIEEQVQVLKQTLQVDHGNLSEISLQITNLITAHAELLNFGTPFDHGGGEAALNYLERQPEVDKEARANRRTLYGVMKAVEMEPYEDEWWHYNAPESQMGAKTALQEKALYGSIKLSSENQNFEAQRRKTAIKALRKSNLPMAAEIKPTS